MNPDGEPATERLRRTREAISLALREGPTPPGGPDAALPDGWLTRQLAGGAASALAKGLLQPGRAAAWPPLGRSGLEVADGLLRPLAQTRPWTLVAVAGLAGAALVLTRPWQFLLPSGLRYRLLTQLASGVAWSAASAMMARPARPGAVANGAMKGAMNGAVSSRGKQDPRPAR